jgi:signal transduction histidine kinase
VAITTTAAIAGVALGLAALDHPRTLLTADDQPVTARAEVLLDIARIAILATFAGSVGVLCALFVRWRRADGETRHQLGALLPSGVLFLLAVVLDTFDVAGAWAIAAVAVPVGMTVAILRYHLYELDRLINRTIVWLVMSLLVVAGFVALVTALRELVLQGSESNASLVATAVIAVAFEPLRRAVQRGVDRMLYGDRDDPYKVIAELGDLLGRTADTRSVFPLLASTIARSLQVSYVAVVLDTRDGARVLAEHGSASTPMESFDMVVHGDHVGHLIVAARSPGSRFAPRERRLLSDVALQAAVAAEATRLIGDLQYSRERLIMAREEERRRIRRDLHDGLGPSLAGMSMQVRAANRLAPEQTRVAQILQGLEGDLRSCASEMRKLVDQLRPPALDNGLKAALHAECQRFTSAALSIRLSSSDDLSGLPAAIEVAAYRIVAEALTNVVRHSDARTCQVTIRRSRSLRISVIDDGTGLTQPTRDGMGLTSMRERAAEVGGECAVRDVDPHGTVIDVELPLADAPAQTSQQTAA